MSSGSSQFFSKVFGWYTPTEYEESFESTANWMSWLATAGAAFVIGLIGFMIASHMSKDPKSNTPVVAAFLAFMIGFAATRPIFYHVIEKPSKDKKSSTLLLF